MAVFWMLAALMTAVALAFVLVPLLRGRPPAGPSAVEANLEVLRGQRRELDADIASGVVTAEARNEALAELVQRAEADLAAPANTVSAEQRTPWPAVAAAAIGVPAIAFGVYLAIGAPAATDPRVATAATMDTKNVADLVERLAQKVRERPDDAKGWALYARSAAALGRYDESAKAYEHLMKLVPGDAQIMADYADVLGMAQGRSLAGRPFEIVKNALMIDPQNNKALALAGTAAMDQGNLVESIGYWERLVALLPPGSDDDKEVRELIAELRSRAGMPAASAPTVAKAPAATAAPPGKSVSGVVTVAPEVASKIASTDTLFVFARAESGPRAPLAVLRGSAKELPLRFALDDTMAMSPQWSLSRASDVRIEARISKSGNAAPQPGDVVGTSAVVKPGAKGVRIVIDKVLP
jgi:cytochrome c-type biogenesis protein CcmH